MNEENITNVIEYIQQNSNQTTETLVQSLVSAGYPLDDIKIGLGRLGLSPLSIPGYTPSIQPPAPQAINLMPGRTLIALAGAAVILISVSYLGNTNLAEILARVPFLGRKPLLSRPVEKKVVVNNDDLKKDPLKANKNPMEAFRKLYENNTYKISITLESKGNQQNSIDLTYYTENGFIDRHDNDAGITYIVRTNAFYTIDHVQKTFSKVESTDFRYGVLAQSLQDAFIINELLAGETADFITWQALANNQWKGTNTVAKSYFILNIDTTGLPTNIELYNDKDELISVDTFIFEPVTINETVLTPPMGYKEVQQIDP